MTIATKLRAIGIAVTVGLLAALPFMVDSFLVNLATQALYLGLFALSINLIAGYAGMVTLGQAGVSGIAGYGLGILLSKTTMPLLPALVIALGCCVVVAIVFGLIAVRASGVFFLMITLAEGMIVWGIAQRWTTVTGGDNGLTGITRPSFALEYWTFYYLTLAVVAVCAVLIAIIVRSPFGLSLKGIREAEGRMGPLGYNVLLHKLVAFTVAGAFAGIAGLLLAMYNSFFSPVAVHIKASADGLLMSILGGIGTLTGAFVGSTIFVVVTNYVSGFLDRWPTLLGLIFVLTILFARDGLVGAWQRLVWAPVLRRLSGPEEAQRALPDAAGPLSSAPSPVASADREKAG
ncbi:MAG TPA: branched-chain amino acid ABC transporter permease [Actinomycetota bacterium]|nr:branched-chain amino acid ABC transporter permease [Actinomycetota bacterium]